MKGKEGIQVKRESHSRPSLLSNFILGSQDGLVNVLGIILGLAAANTNTRIFFVAAFAAHSRSHIDGSGRPHVNKGKKAYVPQRTREEKSKDARFSAD